MHYLNEIPDYYYFASTKWKIQISQNSFLVDFTRYYLLSIND